MNKTMCNTLASLGLLLPLAAMAQAVPAAASSAVAPMAAMPGMAHEHAAHADHAKHAEHAQHDQHAGHARNAEHAQPAAEADMHDMQGHDMHAMPMPAAPATEHAGHAMPAMDHTGMSAHGAQHDMPHGAHDMHDMRMQGGAAPADARRADYSDGMARGDMPGMVMIDKQALGMLRFDRLEAFHGRRDNGQAWELNGWYGNDLDRLWLRSEGEREGGRPGEGDIEALWGHAVSAYWDTRLGLRHDFGGGPSRQWLGFGVQGLAPYWFELEATAYVGAAGRSALRLRGEYELLFTQRLILQPELEANLYGKADRARGIGSGLADASFGLRLRYEFRRRFAPYLGVLWTQRFGGSADAARAAGRATFDRQVVAGLRLWF